VGPRDSELAGTAAKEKEFNQKMSSNLTLCEGALRHKVRDLRKQAFPWRLKKEVTDAIKASKVSTVQDSGARKMPRSSGFVGFQRKRGVEIISLF